MGYPETVSFYRDQHARSLVTARRLHKSGDHKVASLYERDAVGFRKAIGVLSANRHWWW